MLHDEGGWEVQQPHEQGEADEQQPVGPAGQPAGGVGQEQIDDRQFDEPLAQRATLYGGSLDAASAKPTTTSPRR